MVKGLKKWAWLQDQEATLQDVDNNRKRVACGPVGWTDWPIYASVTWTHILSSVLSRPWRLDVLARGLLRVCSLSTILSPIEKSRVVAPRYMHSSLEWSIPRLWWPNLMATKPIRRFHTHMRPEVAHSHGALDSTHHARQAPLQVSVVSSSRQPCIASVMITSLLQNISPSIYHVLR